VRRPSGQHGGERDPLAAMGTPQGQLSDPFRTYENRDACSATFQNGQLCDNTTIRAPIMAGRKAYWECECTYRQEHFPIYLLVELQLGLDAACSRRRRATFLTT
jgi:hypothetical protein